MQGITNDAGLGRVVKNGNKRHRYPKTSSNPNENANSSFLGLHSILMLASSGAASLAIGFFFFSAPASGS